MSTPVLLWFRNDLRLADHPALTEAAAHRVLPVYVLEDADAGAWRAGGASRWWLHRSLDALATALAALGAPLFLARGQAETVIPALADAVGASDVCASRRYEPWARETDRRVHEALAASGRRLRLSAGHLLHEPHRLATGQGKPFSVYSPFAKALRAQVPIPPALPAPPALHGAPHPAGGVALGELRLLPRPPTPDWTAGLADQWQPGEAGGRARLDAFLASALADYAKARDVPAGSTTSRLSPHLAFGEISPRQAWEASAASDKFRSELLWREFSYHLLWHRPGMTEHPLRAAFAHFPWQSNPAFLRAWQLGRTGYPLVDAGMRQLWATGWMHNRVRMVAASFLVKHLLQPWQDGARWFWDTLVDADLANNSASWQWVAGCGSDAAPYFRIFNPVLQGEKFDPEGTYVRQWLPELAALPDSLVHRPWDAKRALDYPTPVIDHDAARQRALDAFARLPKGAEGALELTEG
jgi:deoxyribodipyrimidine photo-lyase